VSSCLYMRCNAFLVQHILLALSNTLARCDCGRAASSNTRAKARSCDTYNLRVCQQHAAGRGCSTPTWCAVSPQTARQADIDRRTDRQAEEQTDGRARESRKAAMYNDRKGTVQGSVHTVLESRTVAGTYVAELAVQRLRHALQLELPGSLCSSIVGWPWPLCPGHPAMGKRTAEPPVKLSRLVRGMSGACPSAAAYP
jgi:hypothetical protein